MNDIQLSHYESSFEGKPNRFDNPDSINYSKLETGYVKTTNEILKYIQFKTEQKKMIVSVARLIKIPKYQRNINFRFMRHVRN